MEEEKKSINLKEALEKRGAKIDENQEKFINSLNEELNSFVENRSKSLSEEFDKKIKELEIPKDLSNEIREIAEKIEKQSSPKVTFSEIQKRNLSNVIKERREEIIDAIKSKKPLDLFEIRAAATHLDTNTTSLGTVLMPDGTTGATVSIPTIENYGENDVISEIRTPQNFIFNLISNRVVSKNDIKQTVFKYEQAPTEGDVAVVAEAGEKPLIQYKFVKNAISRQKYAGRIEWSEEFEMDNEMLFNAIMRMIERDVMMALNDGLYGIITANATAYTTSSSSASVVAPNSTDVAVVLQGLIDAQNYNADTVVVNPQTLTSLLLIKKSDGEYIVNPAFQNGKLNGMNLISSSTVGAGDILVLDSSIYKEVHTNVIMRVGNYNAQFIHNEFTLVAEVFSLIDVAQIDLVASYYGAIATIEADLLKV